MSKTKRAPKGSQPAGERQKKRDEVYKSVALYRDEAGWAGDLASEAGVTIGEFLSPKIRQWLYAEHQAYLRRKLSAGPTAPPTPART